MTPLEASGEYSQMFCSDGKMSIDEVATRTKKARHFRENHLNSSCILYLKKVTSRHLISLTQHMCVLISFKASNLNVSYKLYGPIEQNKS